MNTAEIKPIARIETDYDTKFGIPRQAGLVPEAEGRIVFEPEYRNPDAFRGIEGFSHLWLIWQFSENLREEFSPTVRPPRFGGNQRIGVFATRSPFRPNGLGLSCVRLLRLEQDPKNGPVLVVSGADLMNGTPIFDVKPYIPYADCVPEAREGFAAPPAPELQVEYTPGTEEKIPAEKKAALDKILALDPRPRYKDAEDRIYGMEYAGLEVKFRADSEKLYVLDITKKDSSP